MSASLSPQLGSKSRKTVRGIKEPSVTNQWLNPDKSLGIARPTRAQEVASCLEDVDPIDTRSIAHIVNPISDCLFPEFSTGWDCYESLYLRLVNSKSVFSSDIEY